MHWVGPLVFAASPAEHVADPFRTIAAGGLAFGAVFMATDPVSSPKTKPAIWFYAVLIGSLTVLLRAYSNFPEGVMFAILIGNSFGPISDKVVRDLKARLEAGKDKEGEKAKEDEEQDK
jgi:Na+-transporting NADH:ubiquinone oxidoreductase subunit B